MGWSPFGRRATWTTLKPQFLLRAPPAPLSTHFLASRNSVKGLSHDISSPGSFHLCKGVSFLLLSTPFGGILGGKGDKRTCSICHPGWNVWTQNRPRPHLSTLHLHPNLCLNPFVDSPLLLRRPAGLCLAFPYLSLQPHLASLHLFSSTSAPSPCFLLTLYWSRAYTDKNARKYTAPRILTRWKDQCNQDTGHETEKSQTPEAAFVFLPGTTSPRINIPLTSNPMG